MRFVAGGRLNASESTAVSRKTGNAMRLPRQRGDNGGVKRPKRQAKTEILVPKTRQTVARGHAAKIIFQIFATALGATSCRASPIEHRLAIVAMIAARRSGACAIVNASG